MGLGKGNTGSVVRNHAESCGPAGLAQCYSPVCVKVTESFSCVLFQGITTSLALWSSNHRAGVSLVWTESYREEPGQDSRSLLKHLLPFRQPWELGTSSPAAPLAAGV